MSRKRRHGPPARARQPRQPRQMPQQAAPPAGVVAVRDREHQNGDTGPATVVLRDADGRPYVTLADGSGRSAFGGAQSQQAAARTAQALQARQPATGMTASAAKPYPAMPEISDTKPLLKSLGATGTSIFSGIITSEEYNEDFYWKDAITIYEQMARNDAQIFAIKQLLELPIRRAKWTVEPGGKEARDKEVASFVESCLFHDMRYETSEGRTLTQKWDDILRHILMMLWFGFMLFEVNWRLEDGWVKWARWTPLLPRTIWRWWVGEDNELVGVQQWTFKDYTYQFVDIPADKLLPFVHRQEGNNYEGVSVLRSAYKHWYYKDNYYKIQSIDIERNAVSMPVIYLPENFTNDDLLQAQTIMANMRANEVMGATLPPGWKIEYLRNYERNQAQVQPAIEHHDTMIARNVLGQFINLGSKEVGSYALESGQRLLLLDALQAECEYIEDVINNDAIPRLVDYNYDDVENYPRLKASKLIAQDLGTIADALNKLVSAPSGPLIHGDPDLEDYLRDVYGLPKAPAGVVQGTNPTAPATPDRPETDTAQETAGSDHADAESKDAQPTAKQQSTSQAIANAAPNAVTATGAVQTADAADDAAAAAAIGELGAEARLLREALAAAYDHDAVDRGLVFYNPNHVPGGSRQGGQFAPKGGGGGGIGEGLRAAGGGAGARGRTAASGGRGRSGGAAHHGGGSGGSGGKAKGEGEPKAKGAKSSKAAAKEQTPTESMHERSARLQREQGLANEAQPSEKLSPERMLEKGSNPFHYEDLPKAYQGGDGTLAHNPLASAEESVRLAHLVYGDRQLGAAISGRSMEALREAAQEFGLSKGGSKAELVSRITAHVTEGRYSANFGAGAGTKGSKGEGERATTRAGRGRTRGAKSEEERAAAKLTAARQKVAEAEARVRETEKMNNVHLQSNATEALGKAQLALARAEGRELGPGERGLTREDYLAGKGSVYRNGRFVNVSPEEARAYLTNPTPRGVGKAITGKSAREVELERQLAAAKAENEALKAAQAGGTRAGTKTGEEGAKASGRGAGKAQTKAAEPELKPIGNMPKSYQADPFSSANPHHLVQIYGRAQLEKALRQYTVDSLKETAAKYEANAPGTRPAHRGRTDALIRYIVERYDAGTPYPDEGLNAGILGNGSGA